MEFPDHGRDVPHPFNTLVADNGYDGSIHYAVRERVRTRYVPRGNLQPHNGKVIWHIRNGRFVSKQEPSAFAIVSPDMLSYVALASVKSGSHGFLDDLMDIYPVKEVYMIMAIATL